MKRTKRKRRTTSRNMCPGCYYVGCDNMHGALHTPYIRKRNLRLRNHLCVSCGKNPCKCKRRAHPSNVEKQIRKTEAFLILEKPRKRH